MGFIARQGLYVMFNFASYYGFCPLPSCALCRLTFGFILWANCKTAVSARLLKPHCPYIVMLFVAAMAN